MCWLCISSNLAQLWYSRLKLMAASTKWSKTWGHKFPFHFTLASWGCWIQHLSQALHRHIGIVTGYITALADNSTMFSRPNMDELMLESLLTKLASKSRYNFWLQTKPTWYQSNCQNQWVASLWLCKIYMWALCVKILFNLIADIVKGSW